MAQMPEISKLVSALKIKIDAKPRKLKSPGGPEARLGFLRKTVNALIKFERIEVNWNRGNEARGYAERLISDAIRHGDRHKETMEMADYWLEEKQLMHKLFKVLVPRYTDCNTSFTRVVRLPRPLHSQQDKILLELRGNPYPQIVPEPVNRNLLTNVLLEEAKKEYKAKKFTEFESDLSKESSAPPSGEVSSS